LSLLECKNLSVRFSTDYDEIIAVDNLSLSINESECIGIVGESGSGKTQSFLGMLGLLARNGHTSGSVRFHGEEILNAPRRRLNELRGDRIAMIFQDALSALTPTMRVGNQLAESLIRHRAVSKQAARERALEMLEIVNMPDAAARYRSYPFELSGGQRQRVMIAMAMICRPDLVIADEPTTALDVTVQAQILALLDGLKRHTTTSVVLITHDLAVVAGLCDRVLIMYGGSVVESGPTREIFRQPQHPYTAGLLRSVPSLTGDTECELPTIPGQPPYMPAQGPGCSFAARCAQATDRCALETPQLRTTEPQRQCACHLVESVR